MAVATITERLDDPDEAWESGRTKIEWAREHMPILVALRDDLDLSDQRVGMAMHVEAKTAVLAETLAEAGADVAITGCNPLSTHDDVSAALDAHDRIS
ncbi:adenosylhomocysteinase, partial [Halobacteriales archaeon QH_6_64_20]